jgi:hypothetical protein
VLPAALVRATNGQRSAETSEAGTGVPPAVTVVTAKPNGAGVLYRT